MPPRLLGSILAQRAENSSLRVAERQFAQIYPELVGEEYRDMQVAHEYALRLAKIGKNIEGNAIHRLVNDYPSHDFVIDLREAREIFNKVARPPVWLRDLALAMGPEAFSPRKEVS